MTVLMIAVRMGDRSLLLAWFGEQVRLISVVANKEFLLFS